MIIGAGRGLRLMPTTANTPKCFAEVSGQRILDWTLEAFRANGLDQFCFIGGYQIDRVRDSNPEFTFRHNTNWEHNNILESLFYAEDLMDEPFVCCYSDILFTAEIVERMLERLAVPLTSTSLNEPGRKPARSGAEATEVIERLGRSDIWLLDGGTLPQSGPSTIIDCTSGTPTVLREGAVPVGRLRCVIPEIHGNRS